MKELKDFFKKCFSSILINSLKLPDDDKQIEVLADKFLFYLSELKKWNKAYNLTSIEDEKEIIVKHFIDSLLYLCFISENPLSIADIGTGAGFPGIPIAIVRPRAKITLIEPSWKKNAFLKNIKRKLELENIEIIKAKAEEIHNKFDIVISRALWSIKDFIKHCNHLLKKEGYFLISKSLKIDEEIQNLPERYNIEIREFELPDINSSQIGGKRYIIKIEKCES
ncbi:16S rRNA (guanine(527)-N(7))-methyltransferase RsmG [Thermodesulfovibrio yellowstonii]|uniref:Ribosomal RNA small subunit methyltransferase G n=1 Tax=Thermodesulfovibrio yellowstonii (strain ATCC 51303 / DSM 11347 / YP87) TaxID=289376 RepID=B5YJL2_THEYD|nr:16S rRNA (guanine(527)-N(7))-methyltransferase RsmG [Thermodesulfovibrio yellowstonii]ACI21808.1 methyltransferase GidB [Thermodesulfovibrio yellowstonii DSM 11347]